tara:strand:+ start:521 stop:721 length:201 start_codon:yes stop_codon:yes gene_type:complete
MDYFSYIRGIIKNNKTMGLIYKDSFVVDGERYYHYSYGGKWTSTKFVTVHGITYYNSDVPFEFAPV